MDAGPRYAIERRIAAGGAGTVYLAKRHGPHGFARRVAIKRLHAHLVDDPAMRRALVREARVASLVHHANVVSVVDLDEPDGALGLVMEWVDGASLAELLAAGGRAGAEPLPTAVALRIVLDACAGLAAVHELGDERGRPSGLLHRDVSPQNLLVGRDGVTRVADFGLATISESSMATSTGGVVAGKLGYVAPELLDGRSSSVASDLFALAVVAWEALARRRVLDVAASPLRARGLAPPPALSTVAPWVGDAFDALLLSATSRDPAQRPRDARTLGEALEAIARRRDLLASPREVARAVAKLAPVRPEGRMRVGADGAAAVDYAFAETAALGDGDVARALADQEITLHDVVQETTDPITEEPTPPPSPPALEADRRPTLRRLETPAVPPLAVVDEATPWNDAARPVEAPAPRGPRTRARLAAGAIAVAAVAALGVAIATTRTAATVVSPGGPAVDPAPGPPAPGIGTASVPEPGPVGAEPTAAPVDVIDVDALEPPGAPTAVAPADSAASPAALPRRPSRPVVPTSPPEPPRSVAPPAEKPSPAAPPPPNPYRRP